MRDFFKLMQQVRNPRRDTEPGWTFLKQLRPCSSARAKVCIKRELKKMFIHCRPKGDGNVLKAKLYLQLLKVNVHRVGIIIRISSMSPDNKQTLPLPDVMILLCLCVSVICCNINGADGPLGLCHHPTAKSLISCGAFAGSEGAH